MYKRSNSIRVLFFGRIIIKNYNQSKLLLLSFFWFTRFSGFNLEHFHMSLALFLFWSYLPAPLYVKPSNSPSSVSLRSPELSPSSWIVTGSNKNDSSTLAVSSSPRTSGTHGGGNFFSRSNFQSILAKNGWAYEESEKNIFKNLWKKEKKSNLSSWN